MKVALKTLLVVGILASGSIFGADIDTKASKVEWLGKKVTGQHVGTIGIKSGKLEMKDGKLAGGEVVIDMTTIEATDLEGEWKAKLDGHLKNEDFFNVAKFDTAKFVAKTVTAEGKNLKVAGDLTIKGITKPGSLTLTKSDKGYTGKMTFDRSKFDVKYNSKSFFDVQALGDKMIDDQVELTINLVTK